MGEVKELHKSFTLKFRHICARVTVIKKPDGYLAFIVFPRAYVNMPANFYHALPQMSATTIEYACEMAATQFKVFYAVMDRPMRVIGAFNFFVQRILFRTAIERSVGDSRFQFVVTRQFYGISENIDGKKYAKTTFDNRERTSCFRALFLINFEQVFDPMVKLGFNHKLIQRLLMKHNKVKATQLRIYTDGLFIDDIEKYPERLSYHVADHRFEFQSAIGWEKIKRQLNKSDL